MLTRKSKLWAGALAIASALAMVACGGGGSTTATTSTTAALAMFAGNATNAYALESPHGVAMDADGTLYMADNNAIKKITAAGIVTLLAGSVNASGSADGTGSAASFNSPQGVAVDTAGNVYVADTYNARIRKITSAGVVTTLAGDGSHGFLDGTGTAAEFNHPYGIAVDSSGNLYVGDATNNRIRKITPAGVVTTLAGSGAQGAADGTGTAASFDAPEGVAVDSSGNVYVADLGGKSIRKVTPAGVVTTLTSALSSPEGVAVDASGTVYVADTGFNNVMQVTSAGVVTTLAGSGSAGYADGTGTAASFDYPFSVAVDASGNAYVADSNNGYIRKVTSAAVVTTLVGPTKTGSTNSTTGTDALFNYPGGLAHDAAGNVYVADTNNHIIRKITPAGVVTTLAGAGGKPSSIDGTGTAASFSSPYGIVADSAGNLYVADSSGHKIRKIDSSGNVTTLAGSGSAGYADGAGTAAVFSNPRGIAIDSAGNLYVADNGTGRIRKIDSSGNVTTLAGSGIVGATDGLGTAASFNAPWGLAVDRANNVYVADAGNRKIRKIDSSGNVTTLAGSGSTGTTDGTGTAASFAQPRGIVIDSTGNLYVADTSNSLIRKVTTAGVVTTLVGQAGQSSFTPGDLPGLIYQPLGISTFGKDLYFTVGTTGIAKVSNVVQ